MNTMKSHLGLLKISGEGAKTFLQGQVTCNMDEVSREPRLCAHCNPQGRVISLFNIFLYDNDYYLQMPSEMIAIAKAALQKYAVFFKVILSDASELLEQIGNPYLDWHCKSIQQGIPTIFPETSEKFLPHDLNLPALNAVSFNKGCYTGQEIIARMQYRGKIKNTLHRGKVNAFLTLTRGNDIYLAENIGGILVDFCEINDHYEVLALAQATDIHTHVFYADPERKVKIEWLKN